MYLNKCCPTGTFVGWQKTCDAYNITLKFSKIKVYNENIKLTGTPFEDLFNLLPNKFNDTEFRKEVLDIIALDHNVYLTKVSCY